jgi:hypothetical protein
MSHPSPHTYRGFAIRFDELEPQNAITMSHATWRALEQLESGSEEIPAQRYIVKAKPKFAEGEGNLKLDSHYATWHEAVDRGRTLKAAGYSTEIVEPVEATTEPRSFGRYRVHSQQNPWAPFAQESDFVEQGEAQERANELREQGVNTQIIDSNDGRVVQAVYANGTAVAGPELGNVSHFEPDGGTVHGLNQGPQITEDQRAQQEQAEKNQQYLNDNPEHLQDPRPLPAHTETPEQEWLRKEADAKEHPDPVR